MVRSYPVEGASSDMTFAQRTIRWDWCHSSEVHWECPNPTQGSHKSLCVTIRCTFHINPHLRLLQPKVEVYGPAGIRTFIRSILKMTLTCTADRYVVHELLSANDEVTPCTPPEVMHSSECQGEDIWAGEEDGLWKDFVIKGSVAVDAGLILHRGGS
jgi:hypothetical protein